MKMMFCFFIQLKEQDNGFEVDKPAGWKPASGSPPAFHRPMQPMEVAAQEHFKALDAVRATFNKSQFTMPVAHFFLWSVVCVVCGVLYVLCCMLFVVCCVLCVVCCIFK